MTGMIDTAAVKVEHVVAAHRIAAAKVIAPDGHVHRVAHHPAFGWRCMRCDKPTCQAVNVAKAIITNMEIEATTTPQGDSST